MPESETLTLPMDFEETPLQELDEVTQEIVRPDRNLEKWPIWEPNQARQKPRARALRRDISLPDGSSTAAIVTVGFTHEGVLTTEDQKTFYALVKLWEDSDRSGSPVYFTRLQLAKILRKTWGSKTNAALLSSLKRLRFTPFTWEKSYFDSQTQETMEQLDTFTILSELHLTRRTKDGQTKAEKSYFLFNDRLLQNLLAGFTRPVYLDTILSFQTDLAQILYTYLDLILYDKTRFERKTEGLFQDLGIEGSTYQYASKRKERLEPAIAELQGIALPTGTLKEVRLERTVDGTDYKLVVVKSRARAVRSKNPKPTGPVLLPPVVTSPPPAEPEVDETDSTDNKVVDAIITLFHETFFQTGATARPGARETALAQEHITRLGVEATEFLIRFAYRESKRTKFDIQAYGGVVQYESRAMGEFQKVTQQRSGANLQKARTSHQERYQKTYWLYLGETLAQLEKSPQGAILTFLEGEQRTREALCATNAGEIRRRSAAAFDLPEQRLMRFREFLQEQAKRGERVPGVLSFWEWDAQKNPDGFRPETVSDVR